MNILVTGASGFLGKNLVASLQAQGFRVFEYDLETDPSKLEDFVEMSEFIVHLAGINRPLTNEEFYSGNVNLTFRLINVLKTHKKTIPLIFSSSIQALQDNDYGRSKKMAEDLLLDYQRGFGGQIYIFRLTNLFGKWSRPNYNSVVATFCHNISHDLPIQINNSEAEVNLLYVDDVVNSFMEIIKGNDVGETSLFRSIEPQYPVKLGKLASLISSFKQSRSNLVLPNLGDDFEKKLYATYLSYLDPQDFAYSLKMNMDERGSFTEFLKTQNVGQVSVNITHPGITKGNHYHHTKNEKFLVVKGSALIKLRKIGSVEVIVHAVSDKKMVVVDIPPGYTHSISNDGNQDLVTIMWASELFDINKPDTFFQDVEIG